MNLKLKQFGGLLPKVSAVDPRNLPDTMAQTAQNLNLTAGVLEPIDVTPPFNDLNNGTDITGRVPVGDLVSITKPGAPVLDDLFRFCNPANWFNVTARTWYLHIDDSNPDNVQAIWTQINQQTLSYKWAHYTDRGMEVTFSIANFTYTLTGATTGGAYVVRGPLFQFNLGTGLSYYDGSPASSVDFPDSATPEDPHIVPGTVALETPVDWSNYPADPPSAPSHVTNEYGYLEVVDAVYTNFDNEYANPAADEIDVDFLEGVPNANITFICDLHYADPAHKRVTYRQSMVTADDEEGQPSDVSKEFDVPPGAGIQLIAARSGAYTKNKLYRSVPGYGEYRFLADIDANTYYDTFLIPLTTELPEHGPLPGSAADIQKNSLYHPADFAVVFSADTLYFSDFERPWTYPTAWAITFDTNISAIALAGTAVIVWTAGDDDFDGRVFAVRGSSPSNMHAFELSADAPLLNKLSIMQINQNLFYVSRDGVFQVNAGGVQNITKAHFTREQWDAYTPANMTGKTADDSLFIEDGASNLRIDLDEDVARVTTFTATTGVSATWKSKKLVFSRPTRFNCYRCDASDYDVTFKIYGDGSLLQTVTVADSDPARLAQYQPARECEIQIESAYTVYNLELATNFAELT